MPPDERTPPNIKGLSREAVDIYLEVLWDELGDVPFDENESGELILAEDWYHFKAGTERDEIWHWFDKLYSYGVYSLLYGRKEQIK